MPTKMMFLNLLLLLLLLGVVVSAPAATKPKLSSYPMQMKNEMLDVHRKLKESQTASISIDTDQFSSWRQQGRLLQDDDVQLAEQHNNDTAVDVCSICRGATVLADRLPFFPVDVGLPENVTCGEFEVFAQQFVPVETCESNGIRQLYAQCCTGAVPLYKCESNIRKKLLEDYDAAVAPVPNNLAPVEVIVTLESHAIEYIDVQAGTARILCSVFLEWTDERLKWEQDEDTCAGFVTMWTGQDQEKTEIWVPDLDLYNQVQGLQLLPDTQAVVASNGRIFWNRNGGITAFCQFQGLSQIPFDVLGCQLLIGPWVRQDPTQLVYTLSNGTGLVQGKFQATFNEYLPVPELAQSGTTFGGAVMYFNLYYQRSQKYYVNNLLIPTIILTYVSMGTFLLDLRVGERLSYGMALALVVVAQQIATGGLVPVSNERLWIDKFIGWSFYWVIVGLVESVCIGYIYFLREDKASKLSRGGGNAIYDGMRESDYVDHSSSDDKSEMEETNDWSSPLPEQSANEGYDEVIDCDNFDAYLVEQQKVPGRQHRRTSGRGRQPELQKRNSTTGRRFSTLKQQLQHNHPSPQPPSAPSKKDEKVFGRIHWMYTVSLRRVDRFFFFLTLTTYTLFIIAMFISRPYWGQNLESVWLDESTTVWDRNIAGLE